MSEDRFYDFIHDNGEYEKQYNSDSPFMIVDYEDLYNWNAEYTLKFQELASRKLPEMESISGKPVKIINMLETHPVHALNSKTLYSFIQVEGTTIQIEAPTPRPIMIVYECKECGYLNYVEQDEQFRTQPDQCALTDCNNRKDFKKRLDLSRYDDYQWIKIQELMKNTPQRHSPATVDVLLKNELVNTCVPGENVVIVGFMKVQDKSSTSKELELEIYLEAHSVVNATEQMDEVLSPEDVAKVEEVMSQPDHLQKIVASFAPTIHGEDHIKEALAYQQCKGNVKYINEERRRGDFHVLLAGAPGVGKSILGEFSAKCHPKGRRATGRGSSGVGLTASVVKENSKWVMKAGAMVLADLGHLFIDEIEKMSKEDSGAMHPGMSAQEIPVSKAGLYALLKTRCSVAAACNPLDGVWNDHKTLVGNLHDGQRGLGLALINRFALIFVMRQNYDVDKEEEVITHIAKLNTRKNYINPPYSLSFLRKIFTYARTIEPVIPEEIMQYGIDFYMTIFKASLSENTMIFSRRQQEDIIRVTEASAKAHGRWIAIEEDIENAVRVVTMSVKEYGIDPTTGKIDQTQFYSGLDPSSSLIDRMIAVEALIRKIKQEDEDGKCSEGDLKDALFERQWMDSVVDKTLKLMERDKRIYYSLGYVDVA